MTAFDPYRCSSLTAMTCPQCGTCTCEVDPAEWAELCLKPQLTRAESKRWIELDQALMTRTRVSGCPLHSAESRHAFLTAVGDTK